jgi:hypothetical protein
MCPPGHRRCQGRGLSLLRLVRRCLPLQVRQLLEEGDMLRSQVRELQEASTTDAQQLARLKEEEAATAAKLARSHSVRGGCQRPFGL